MSAVAIIPTVTPALRLPAGQALRINSLREAGAQTRCPMGLHATVSPEFPDLRVWAPAFAGVTR